MIMFNEAEDTKKEITLAWVPKWGPCFCDPDGKSNKDIEKLNSELWKTMADFKGSVDEFHDKAKKAAEEAGFKLKTDFYDDKLHEALSADELDEFVKALKAGVVDFEFEKADGTVRKAKGTLNPELMDVPEKKVEDAGKKKFMPPTVQVFWDVEKEGFRSCRKASVTKWKAEEKKED